MKKFVCTICGYVHQGDSAPEKCPQCMAPAFKFNEQKEGMSWAAEHVVGRMQCSDYKLVCSSFDVTSVLWLEQCHVGQHIIGSGIL